MEKYQEDASETLMGNISRIERSFFLAPEKQKGRAVSSIFDIIVELVREKNFKLAWRILKNVECALNFKENKKGEKE